MPCAGLGSAAVEGRRARGCRVRTEIPRVYQNHKARIVEHSGRLPFLSMAGTVRPDVPMPTLPPVRRFTRTARKGTLSKCHGEAMVYKAPRPEASPHASTAAFARNRRSSSFSSSTSALNRSRCTISRRRSSSRRLQALSGLWVGASLWRDPTPGRAGERQEEWWHAAVFRFEVLQKCTSWVWYIQDACAEHAAGASLLSRVPLEDGNGVGRRPHDHFGPGPQGLQGGPGQPRVGVDAERAVAHRAIPVQSLPPVPQAADPALV